MATVCTYAEETSGLLPSLYREKRKAEVRGTDVDYGGRELSEGGNVIMVLGQ